MLIIPKDVNVFPVPGGPFIKVNLFKIIINFTGFSKFTASFMAVHWLALKRALISGF
jgi:hypothetical protein